MTDALAGVATGVIWVVVILTWMVGGLYNFLHPRGALTKDSRSQLVVIIVAVVCAIIVVTTRGTLDKLTVTVAWVRVLGLVILAASAAFAVWARASLGTSWTFGATVKDANQLVTTGAYRVTRNPIYTGLLGMLIGTTLLNEVGQWIILFPVGFILMALKTHAEERTLIASFPREYERYRRQVPQLVPGLYVLRRHHPAS